MPISVRHQRACESSDGPPLHRIQVTNACVCTFLHAFLPRITTSSIKNVHRNLVSLTRLPIFEEPAVVRARLADANIIRRVVRWSLGTGTVDFLRDAGVSDATKPFSPHRC